MNERINPYKRAKDSDSAETSKCTKMRVRASAIKKTRLKQ